MVKVERSQPAPESLAREAAKVNGRYNLEDVTSRLEKDFHGKCYLCETKGLQDPEVEHLFPHKNGKYPQRKFDWDNLFWACGHCNKMKNREKYDAGIVDCCKEDPEKLLDFRIDNDSGDVLIVPLDKSHVRAILTAELLDDVFNRRNTGIRISACRQRIRGLQMEMNLLYQKLKLYKDSPKDLVIQDNLRILLRRESAFAAFKRAYVRKNLSAFPGLEQFLGD